MAPRNASQSDSIAKALQAAFKEGMSDKANLASVKQAAKQLAYYADEAAESAFQPSKMAVMPIGTFTKLADRVWELAWYMGAASVRPEEKKAADVNLNPLDQFIAARVASRVAKGKGKRSEAPPKELVKAVEAAASKMEGALKSKTGMKWEFMGGSEYEDGLYSAWFQGPTKPGTRSPVPREVNGRFNIHFQVVRGGHSDDGTIDITATYLPWVKDRFEMGDSIEAQERGVEVSKADEMAVKLLGEVASKAKPLMMKKK